MTLLRRAACVLTGLSLSVCPLAAQTPTPQTPPAQTPPASPAPTTTPAQTSGDTPQVDLSPLPVDLTRIKRVLERTPTTTRVDETGLRFYLEIIARHPTFKDILGKDYDLRNGPVPNSAMTYQDFVSMVTPKYMNSSAGFTATDTLQASLVNWAAQSVIRKGINALKKARNDAEIHAINQQIDRELAALRGGGG